MTKCKTCLHEEKKFKVKFTWNFPDYMARNLPPYITQGAKIVLSLFCLLVRLMLKIKFTKQANGSKIYPCILMFKVSDCSLSLSLSPSRKTTQQVSDSTKSETGNINILRDFIVLFIFKRLYTIL